MAKARQVIFEVEDNYQKQTYRTRCYIYGPNGRQLLNIPVRHNNRSRKTKDIKVDKDILWQKLHLRALQTAYRSSPFFEFYEDEFVQFFDNTPDYLIDLNFRAHELIAGFIQIGNPYAKTLEYRPEKNEANDFRYLVNAKANTKYGLDKYTQVFSDKFGFLENLSILDLLFMEGNNALNYLENQSLEIS